MYNVEKFKVKKLTIKIYQDEDTTNPYKDWDQLSSVACWLRNYDLDSKDNNFSSFDEFDEARKAGELAFYGSLDFGYQADRVSMDAGDSGDDRSDGMVYVTLANAKKEFPNYSGRTLWLACQKVAKAEIEALRMYIEGEVYGYEISKDGEVLDSLWGCYGLDYCKEEAISVAKAIIERKKEKKRAKLMQSLEAFV